MAIFILSTSVHLFFDESKKFTPDGSSFSTLLGFFRLTTTEVRCYFVIKKYQGCRPVNERHLLLHLLVLFGIWFLVGWHQTDLLPLAICNERENSSNGTTKNGELCHLTTWTCVNEVDWILHPSSTCYRETRAESAVLWHCPTTLMTRPDGAHEMWRDVAPCRVPRWRDCHKKPLKL